MEMARSPRETTAAERLGGDAGNGQTGQSVPRARGTPASWKPLRSKARSKRSPQWSPTSLRRLTVPNDNHISG